MAKAKQVQLQADLTTEDEWEKFLQRDGLLVVDVYSEWCGPCVAMQGNLKKIKLESGGDFLNLGMARSDNIEALKRFRGKSEPTWMFIAQGQQVRLVFGSNAPELQKFIMDEMKNERACLEGSRKRIERLPEEYSEEEQVVYDKLEAQAADRERLKVEKAFKQMKDRRIAQAKNILDTMAHLGLIVIFPHAIKKSQDVLEEFLPNTGIAISKKDRPQLTEEALEEIEFLSPDKMPAMCRAHLCSDKAFALMLTVDQEMNPGAIDETVLKFAYGPTKIAPGEPGTPAYALLKSQINKKVLEEAVPEPIVEETAEEVLGEDEGMEEGEEEELGEEEEVQQQEPELQYPTRYSDDLAPMMEEVEPVMEEEVEEEEEEDWWGLWAPANELVKSTALKYCFPLITSALILPEPEPIPPHVAIAFEVFKKHDVYKLMDEYEPEIMAYGFFTSDVPDEAELIATSKKAYEKQFTGTQYGEKLVVKVAKRKSDPILAFAQLVPSYMSSNVDAGERDCAIFFPENYKQIEEPEPPPKRVSAEDEEGGETLQPDEMVFEGVLQGEEDEDVGELGGEVEEIPPMELSELPQVELDEEEEDGGGQDKATSPPPPPPMEEVPPPPPPEADAPLPAEEEEEEDG